MDALAGLLKVLEHQLAALPEAQLVEVLRTLDPKFLKAALAAAPPPGAGSTDESGADKRRHARQRTLRGGKILYDDRRCSVDCQVRDISESGCRIRLTTTMMLPKTFELQIQGSPGIYVCEVKWRAGSEMGLHFMR